MDEFEYMRNSYLIVDNVPIRKRADMQEMVEKRGYKCVYLLPYFPELNTIEQFWSAVKSKLKRHEVFQEETL